jgi:hypothetical protein
MSAGSAASAQDDSAQSLARKLAAITKVSVIAVAFLYGLGLLVTNEYLITIGVSDFTSVRPKYIVTGVWVLSIVAATFIPILFPLLARERHMAGKIGSAAVGTGAVGRRAAQRSATKASIVILCLSLSLARQPAAS